LISAKCQTLLKNEVFSKEKITVEQERNKMLNGQEKRIRC